MNKTNYVGLKVIRRNNKDGQKKSLFNEQEQIRQIHFFLSVPSGEKAIEIGNESDETVSKGNDQNDAKFLVDARHQLTDQ